MMHLSTPFGRRPLTAAQIAAQAKAAACPAEATVDKWTVVRNIAAARIELGLGDRAIAVLTALVSFCPGNLLEAGESGRLIVFPSNIQVRQRAHGIAEATLRHHLGALVEAGIVIRRDSPNGKRYARKGEGGTGEAFGFDLVPLIARAAEFEAAAERIAAAERAIRLAKEHVSLLRRDLRKLIDWAASAGAPGPWESLSVRLDQAVAALPRRPLGDVLVATELVLSGLLNEAHNHLDIEAESQKFDGNARENERHHQNSKPDNLEHEEAFEECVEEPAAPKTSSGEAPRYPLPMVLEACPDIIDYARHGIRTWGDLTQTAELVRGLLGISPSAWLAACDAMGRETAAVTVAAILQRSAYIRSPGGYLRSLVERKRAGQFSLGPVLQALLRTGLAASDEGQQQPNTSAAWRGSAGRDSVAFGHRPPQRE